jgi:hypothetical protein
MPEPKYPIAEISPKADQTSPNPWDLRVLDGARVTFYHVEGGLFAATVEDESYLGVLVTQAFPRSEPGHYLVLFAADGKELGMLTDSRDLDDHSQKALALELQRRYVRARVTRIERVYQTPGSWNFDLYTDRGPLELSMRNLHEHLEGLGQDRLVLTDGDGRTCEIPSIAALDPHSQHELAKIL